MVSEKEGDLNMINWVCPLVTTSELIVNEDPSDLSIASIEVARVIFSPPVLPFGVIK